MNTQYNNCIHEYEVIYSDNKTIIEKCKNCDDTYKYVESNNWEIFGFCLLGIAILFIVYQIFF